MRSMFRNKTSLKNWPGGRRNATVIEKLDTNRSVPLWNKRIVNMTATWNEDGTRTYLGPELPKEEPVEEPTKE